MVRAPRTVAVACMIVALAGCGTAADAGRSFGGGKLVKDIATRLTQANTKAYTASFSLSDNTTVSIAHAVNPARTAYRFAGGLVLLLPDRTTSCKISDTSAKCSDSSPVSPGTATSPAVDATVERGGMIRPEAVIARLEQTALDANAIVSETDRTLAGTNATCVSVTGVPTADQFSACVTTDGLLGAFTGTIAGTHIHIELDRYLMTTDPTAFNLPRGA